MLKGNVHSVKPKFKKKGSYSARCHSMFKPGFLRTAGSRRVGFTPGPLLQSSSACVHTRNQQYQPT